MLNVLSEDGEVEEVEGDGGGGGVPLLVLLAEPNLLAKKTEVRLVGHQTQHYLREKE